LFSPSITAVAQPVEAISEQIVKQLMHLLNNTVASVEIKQVILETELVVRQSSAAAKKKLTRNTKTGKK
jgi:LacI family transcriptional regulator